MKKFWSIAAIILIGLVLRLIFIDKPDGLWNDEYVSWYIASTPFNEGFWSAVKSQCHMPIYYLYLKIFMSIFGQEDLILRLTSLISGIAAIPIMYFVGKEKDSHTGYLCAGFCAISSFLIYYSQEVRLYSLLFAISSACLLYTLRVVKEPIRKNVFYFILFNSLIILTHTIGFIFVFLNLIYISIFLQKKYPKIILSTWLTVAVLLTLSTPLIFDILLSNGISQWWGHFSLSKIGFLITDYFSPVLTNLTNAPDNFFYMPKNIPFMLITSIIGVICIIKAILNNKENKFLLYVCLSDIVILIIASILGKLVFITKYSIEIYPILIYLACFGMSSIGNKYLKQILLAIFCITSLGYILIYPYSAPKMHRAEGHKIVMDMLTRTNLKTGDYIILQYYPANRYEKYFDFSPYKVISMDKGNFQNYILSKKATNIEKNNSDLFYKNAFLSNKNDFFEQKLSKEILNNLQIGQSVVLVILDSVSFYSPDDIINITENEIKYSKTPFLFLVFSYLKKETFLGLAKSLVVTQIENKGRWTVVKFTKLNNQ